MTEHNDNSTAIARSATQALSEQVRLVHEYLLTGRKLTNLVALTNLGVGSLSSRIAELRGMGVRILDEWKKDHGGKRYKAYRLETSKAEEAGTR
jgi:hypothetical protein